MNKSFFTKKVFFIIIFSFLVCGYNTANATITHVEYNKSKNIVTDIRKNDTIKGVVYKQYNIKILKVHYFKNNNIVAYKKSNKSINIVRYKTTKHNKINNIRNYL